MRSGVQRSRFKAVLEFLLPNSDWRMGGETLFSAGSSESWRENDNLLTNNQVFEVNLAKDPILTTASENEEESTKPIRD